MQKQTLAGDHPNLDVAAFQQLIQPHIAFLLQHRIRFDVHLVPAFLDRHGPTRSDLEIHRIQLGIADNLHLGYFGDLLPDQLENRAAEIPRDAVIRRGTIQSLGKEFLVKCLGAG